MGKLLVMLFAAVLTVGATGAALTRADGGSVPAPRFEVVSTTGDAGAHPIVGLGRR